MGREAALLVVLNPDSTADEDELLGLYRARVAKWCVPTRILRVDSLPTSATGKVQKNILRAQYAHRTTAMPLD